MRGGEKRQWIDERQALQHESEQRAAFVFARGIVGTMHAPAILRRRAPIEFGERERSQSVRIGICQKLRCGAIARARCRLCWCEQRPQRSRLAAGIPHRVGIVNALHQCIAHEAANQHHDVQLAIFAGALGFERHTLGSKEHFRRGASRLCRGSFRAPMIPTTSCRRFSVAGAASRARQRDAHAKRRASPHALLSTVRFVARARRRLGAFSSAEQKRAQTRDSRFTREGISTASRAAASNIGGAYPSICQRPASMPGEDARR